MAGVWSSRRRLWKGEKERMVVVKAFSVFSLPFVLAETLTGIVSFITGELTIPPAVGIGTAVDLIILMAGLGVVIQRALKAKQSKTDIIDKAAGR